MILIKAENLTKRYGETVVVNGVSLEISEGEFISISGASGSGKTTLLNMLATYLPPTSGSIVICGTNVCTCSQKEVRELRRHTIGFCYQFSNLVGELSVKQNILLPLTFGRIPLDKDLYDYLITMLGIGALINKNAAKLSGGEAQRVAIAASLIKKPKVVFLDEPIGSLDSKNGEAVIELLHKLNAELGTALVQVTHNPQSTLNTRIISIRDGKISS